MLGNLLDYHGYGQDIHLVTVSSAVHHPRLPKSHHSRRPGLCLLGSHRHHWNPAPLPPGDGHVGAEGHGEPAKMPPHQNVHDGRLGAQSGPRLCRFVPAVVRGLEFEIASVRKIDRDGSVFTGRTVSEPPPLSFASFLLSAADRDLTLTDERKGAASQV